MMDCLWKIFGNFEESRSNLNGKIILLFIDTFWFVVHNLYTYLKQEVFLTTNTQPACPSCGRSDHSQKVSLLYIAATTYLSHQKNADQNTLDAVLFDLIPGDSEHGRSNFLQQLVKHLSPPAGQKQISRPIHPDWMIIFGCAVGFIFIYQMSLADPGSLPIIVSLLSIGLLIYIITRRPLLNRYQERIGREREAFDRLDLATQRWMRLYLCSRDALVFDPERQVYVSFEQLNDLLFDPEEKPHYPVSGGKV